MKTTNIKVLEKKHKDIEKKLRKDPYNKMLTKKLKEIEKSLYL